MNKWVVLIKRVNQTTLEKHILITFMIILFFFPFRVWASISDRQKTSSEQYFYSDSILIVVEEFSQAVKVFRWLDQINLTESGNDTLNAINQSGHQLTIYHSDAALISAGLTSAPLSSNLTNGKGEDVEIKFYFKMGKEGTNCVLGEKNRYIEYTAIQNLFHELAHARHKMNGTWLYFASEKQAILDENQFRIDWAEYRSQSKAEQRNEYAENEEIVKLTEGKCKLQKFASQ